MSAAQFNEGQKVKCINSKILEGNDNGPALVENQEYLIIKIIRDSEGNPHLDIGLKSSLSYVRSYETKEDLPDGNKIHWCHPSRFVLI